MYNTRILPGTLHVPLHACSCQLSRLVSARPGPDQLEQEHPGLLEAGTLALVFEERVMPRPAAHVESEGGPEHLVSFEALMTWPDVQVFIVVVMYKLTAT